MPKLEQQLSEGIAYELVPEGEYGWNVRLLEEYPETVIKFGTVTLEDEQLKWNMEIVSSPDPDLTTESLTFQDYCGNILLNIMDTSLSEGSAIIRDKDTGDVAYTSEGVKEELNDWYKSTTNDTEESSN